ncbi:hypothetical protein BXL21_26965, partial [Salmonella enterica subsp. enterica serovar Enteritidis]|nr:hypothetical protein [Salmonella enterica subsp. enterica serovar Enteritidis]
RSQQGQKFSACQLIVKHQHLFAIHFPRILCRNCLAMKDGLTPAVNASGQKYVAYGTDSGGEYQHVLQR